ncbi:hypothetical protein Dsin_025095 [Dipteronia sinensis]|uniref:CCHC-type domain-containing protein n=1 Tax=Dipteronia sinensis TaxID=43782 RepID=A0AAE0DWH6_9ROSI|nr:hypothetical protein Dsin_025095 [Dipteronia sinensis]
MPVWVRPSKIPLECIDVELLRMIGGMLGTTYKVDHITESQARGRFDRICVELDITKPLNSTLEVEDMWIRVEYGSLGLICFQCGRVGHSKDSCIEEVVNHKEGDKVHRKEPSSGTTSSDPRLSGSKNDTYGPWMQVSYGRNERNNMGSTFGDEKSGYMGNIEKTDSNSRHGSGYPSHGVEVIGKGVGNRKEVVKALVMKNGRKVVYSVKDDTSNGINKGKQVSTEMNEDLEDSYVLQSLHKDMMDSVMIVTNLPYSDIYIYDCITVLVEGKSGSGVLGDGSIGALTLQQVDVSAAKDFDEVASNLHEAIEVTLEYGCLCNVKLKVVASSKHSITTVIAEGTNFWVLTAVYANPSATVRHYMWDYLSALRRCFKGPWVFIGDFNDIFSSREKRGGMNCFSIKGFAK